jgi:hypothetical protein
MRLLSCRDAAPLLAANPFQMSAATARMRVRRNCRARKSEPSSVHTPARKQNLALFSLITADFFVTSGKN